MRVPAIVNPRSVRMIVGSWLDAAAIKKTLIRSYFHHISYLKSKFRVKSSAFRVSRLKSGVKKAMPTAGYAYAPVFYLKKAYH
jgi:hypothetical protein